MPSCSACCPSDAEPDVIGAVADLVSAHDGFLLDAWGVLVSQQGPTEQGRAFVALLEREGVPYVVVTNDASSLPETIAARFSRGGLPVPPERIVTAGSLLRDFFAERGLVGAPTVVLGTQESAVYVRRAGGVVVPPDGEPAVVAVCDQTGYDLLSTVDAVVTALFAALDAGRTAWVVVPNPDIVYPAGPNRYGVTAGAVAAVIEAALDARYGEDAPSVHRLGKPDPRLFHKGMSLLLQWGVVRPVVVGDQVRTDIAGASAAGLPSVLLRSGIARHTVLPGAVPTYVTDRLV